MKFSKKSEIVVITGASAGIGRATVRRFAKEGARIGLLARGVDGLKAAQREVIEEGGEALVIPTDVSDAKQVEAAAEQVESTFGPMDIWINDAMASVFSPFKEMTSDEFRRVTEVTYLGTVYGTMSALKRMLPRNHGTIVQVGSALAYRSIPLQSAYCGAKHAIHGFTDSLRCELIHDKSKVHITMVQLPGVNTTQFGWVKSRLPRKPKPIGKIYQPEVAAHAIYWAAHHRRRELYVGTSAAEVIVGNKIVPSVLDEYLGKIGYSGQQTSEPKDANRRDNLWEPLPGDHGAHGTFDAESLDSSKELWLAKNRNLLGLAVAGVGAAGLALLLKRDKNHKPA
jgi:NAD(P)-dependent dehydrogenase (short-subunit alcohol dehydrogenase family)